MHCRVKKPFHPEATSPKQLWKQKNRKTFGLSDRKQTVRKQSKTRQKHRTSMLCRRKDGMT